MKTCTKCGETKALDAYHTDRSKPSGLSAWCKACALAPRHPRTQDPKRCVKCAQIKPASEFWSSPRNKDGLFSECKPCSAASNREWRRQHPERVKQLTAVARARYPDRYAARSRESSKAYAEAKGAEWRNQKARNERAKLSAYYVKSCLVYGTELRRDQLPAELIEKKREELRLQRLAREMKQAATKGKP